MPRRPQPRSSPMNAGQGPHLAGRARVSNNVSTGDDEASGAGESQGRAGGPTSRSSGPDPKLGCPFFKRDPLRHSKHRSCTGPGWTTVHRVKEHIYRQHALPICCPRCGATFARDTELVAHSRAPQACSVRVFQIPDGFNQEQERLLKRRRKQAGTEGDKWKEMYRVLFPGDDEEDIPSPYHKDEQELTWEERRAQELHEYEQFLRRELPRSVGHRLEIAAPQISVPLESALKTQLVDIVRHCQSEVFQQYRGVDSSPANSAMPAPVEPPPTSPPDIFLPYTGALQERDAVTPADVDFLALYPPLQVGGDYVNLLETEMCFPALFTTEPNGDPPSVSHSGYGSAGIGVRSPSPSDVFFGAEWK